MNTRREVTIGPALAADAPAMAAILTDWAARSGLALPARDPEENRTFCANLVATQEVFVARDPRFLGFLARDGDVVTALYVVAGERGGGIGSRLVEAAREGRNRLILWTHAANREAVRFWQRAGFRIAGLNEGGEEGLPDLCLEWAVEEQP